MANEAFEKPSEVQAVDGEVTVIGPGRTGLSFTRKAARETAERLRSAAEDAEGAPTKSD